MISDITLGQFFPGNSFLHRLNPETKIILSSVYLVAVFLSNNPISFALLTVFTVLCVILSQISLKVILKGLKPLIVVLIFASVLNVFMTSGENLLVEWWIFQIYLEGVIRAFFMSARVVLLIIGTSVLLTYTTSPIALTDGLDNLLSPLQKLRIPVHIFSMMMSIALRFIPTLVEETEKIMNAQKSRGADFTTGGLIKRAKALIPILVPLFVSSFKRAEELATAMECRCYRVDSVRTKMKENHFGKADVVGLCMMAAFIAGMIILRKTNASGEALVYQILFYRF